jgi:hypothetical protein
LVHTYRDPKAVDDKTLRFVVPLVGCLIFAALTLFTLVHGFTWGERGEAAAAIVLFFGLTYLSDRRYRSSRCAEIRLDDDGTCELETNRKVIRLHVNQIGSVKYVRDPDSRADYDIYYQGGSVPVERGMTDFPDFLSRLKALNPTVDLTSFPSYAWPGLRTPMSQEREANLSRRIRVALFPVGVVVVLAWMAVETVGGPRLPSADLLVSLLPFVVLCGVWVLIIGFMQKRRRNDSR